MIEENQYSEATLPLQYSAQEIRQQLLGAFQVLSDKAPSAGLLHKSHQVIDAMMKCDLFFDTCLQLLEEFQYSKEYSNMPTLIITTLSKFLKHQQASSRLNKRLDRHTLNNKLIAFFTQPSVLEDYRIMFVKSYTQFIFSLGMETIRGQTVELLCNQFGLLGVAIRNYLSIGKGIPEDQVFHAMSYIFIARALTKGPIELSMMRNIVKVFLPTLQTLSLYFLAVFAKAIYEKDEQLFMETSGICSKLIEFFKELVIGTSKENLGLLKASIMKDPQVKEIIQTVLFLTIQNSTLPPNKHLIQLVIDANGNKYIERINEMKQNCVAIINHYAKICVTVQSAFKQLEKEEYKVPLQICNFFLYNAPEIIVREFTALNYPAKALPHHGLFKISLVALSNIIRLHQFFDESFKIRNRLFFQVCLPLMQRNPNQRFHSAEDFKGKRQDILNAHCSDIPENAACKLIEAYTDRIDGSVMVFSNALCQAIEFHLTANPNSFSKLPAQLTESSFFKETDYLLQIEACISGLSVFSYMSIGRQELVVMMEELFISRRSFLLNPSNNGMLKSAILLAYTYYVDNFYTNLKEQKSSHRELHLEILEYCCRNIEQYSQSDDDQNCSEGLCLKIGALQSIDCISNCISQKHFLPALFWNNENIHQKVQDSHFYNLFIFLVKQLWGKFNVQIIDVLMEFITESIKNQCSYGHALKRDHYEYKEVPMVIRDEVCSLIIQDIYKVYNTNTIPNHALMKCKVTNLLELILTCCEFPKQVLNNQFFSLRVEDDDVWEIAGPIDIFLRRMVVFRQEGRDINEQAMAMITISAVNLMQIALRDQKMDKLFGIIVNIIVLGSDGIDDLAICLSNCLVNLLKMEDQSNNYEQDLESMIEKLSYLNLIAINQRFSPRTQETWCFLTERIQQFLENRSSKGIVAAKSIPYVGKLLAISLVCIQNMQKLFNVGETQKTVHLLNNILRTADVYVTTAERQIIASIFIRLIDSRGVVEETDDSHKRCFALVSHVLYKAYSKAFKVNKQNYDENDDDSSSSNCDLSDEEEKEEIPNYKEYKIASNEYSKRQKKEKYIHLFKELCHKLKSTSSEFLKSAVEALPLPIQNFVKTQVFYYQSVSKQSQPMRKVIKVKKESATSE